MIWKARKKNPNIKKTKPKWHLWTSDIYALKSPIFLMQTKSNCPEEQKQINKLKDHRIFQIIINNQEIYKAPVNFRDQINSFSSWKHNQTSMRRDEILTGLRREESEGIPSTALKKPSLDFFKLWILSPTTAIGPISGENAKVLASQRRRRRSGGFQKDVFTSHPLKNREINFYLLSFTLHPLS